MTGTLWKRLWEATPNALVVVDAQMRVRWVNPAFCRMFMVLPVEVEGQPVSQLLGDVSDLVWVLQNQKAIKAREKEYPPHHLFVRQVIYPLPEENLVVCEMMDASHELERRNELRQLKRDTIERVNQVVNRQMKVAQEIAGLLGETTGETKVSLLKLIEMIEQEMRPGE